MTSSRGFSSLLERFRAGLSLDRVLWNGQDDRLQTAVLPPGIDEVRAVIELLRAAHRVVLAAPAPVRLRLAIHEGLVALVDGNFRGPAISTARALCLDLQVLPTEADLVVVLSERISDDLSELGVQPFPAARFHPITAGSLSARAVVWCHDSGR
jgi:hypothetical protein